MFSLFLENSLWSRWRLVESVNGVLGTQFCIVNLNFVREMGEVEMVSPLKRSLKGLCCSNGWCYGVFWSFDKRNSM